LVIVAAVRRLHPRHWDGHRLLQFLTGLALLALAFGTTAASAAPASPPATVVTTTIEAPAAPASAHAVRDDEASASVRTARDSAECQHDASRVSHAVPPAADAELAGVVQQAHGSRAPPR
jgi:hypothetical protein